MIITGNARASCRLSTCHTHALGMMDDDCALISMSHRHSRYLHTKRHHHHPLETEGNGRGSGMCGGENALQYLLCSTLIRALLLSRRPLTWADTHVFYCLLIAHKSRPPLTNQCSVIGCLSHPHVAKPQHLLGPSCQATVCTISSQFMGSMCCVPLDVKHSKGELSRCFLADARHP